MSTFHTVELTCAGCGEPFEGRLLDSLNAERHPAGRQQLLDRTLHLLPCPRCDVRNLVDKPMLYTDLSQALFIQCLPETLRLRFEVDEQEIIEVHRRVFTGDRSPPFVREIGHLAAPRLVYGYEELREKIVAAEAELDDRLVEVLKLQLLMMWPDLLAAGARVLLLDAVTEERGVELVVLYASDAEADGQQLPPPDGLPRKVGLPMERYRELVAQRDSLARTYPRLFAPGWVNILRYKFDPADLEETDVA